MANEFREYDGAEKLQSVYVWSGRHDSTSRIDVLKPAGAAKPLWQAVLDAFLPVGYPASVTDDYLSYQIYDSLQAFSSSIAGLLASRAVLEGVGVGDASASPTAALLLEIAQESMGRIGTILFAFRLGTALEPECKMYRLAADMFNDAAMVMDCLSPALPKGVRVVVLGFSSVLRALCGVAAGSSKASLSAHFARCGNLGELNAKDSSQETVIGLLGMLAGSMVVSRVTSLGATWTLLVMLLTIHLSMNYAAVRAVRMRSLNRQRANILFSHILETGQILTVEQVSEREAVFERDGVLRWMGSKVVGYAVIGAPTRLLLRAMSHGKGHATTGSFKNPGNSFDKLLKLFEGARYVLWFEAGSKQATIVLKRGASARDQLQGWVHALAMAKRFSTADKKGAGSSDDQVLAEIEASMKEATQAMERHKAEIQSAGFDLDTAAIETRAGSRLALDESREDDRGQDGTSPR